MKNNLSISKLLGNSKQVKLENNNQTKLDPVENAKKKIEIIKKKIENSLSKYTIPHTLKDPKLEYVLLKLIDAIDDLDQQLMFAEFSDWLTTHRTFQAPEVQWRCWHLLVKKLNDEFPNDSKLIKIYNSHVFQS